MPTNDKLAAAAHLVIARLRADQLGAVKLNKILWFADCEHFRRHGRSLTGETEYVRKDNGPCPHRMEVALSSLKDRGLIVETLQPVMNYALREFAPTVEPDLSCFTAEEVDLLLSTALEVARLTAAEASALSHDALWEEIPNYERIPVSAGAVRSREPSATTVDWARDAFAGTSPGRREAFGLSWRLQLPPIWRAFSNHIPSSTGDGGRSKSASASRPTAKASAPRGTRLRG